jgi:endonuclease III
MAAGRVRTRLSAIVARLRTFHGAPTLPTATDPYRLLLLEHVAYLGSDEDRAAAFAHLEDQIGTRPKEILAASDAALRRVTRLGGAIAADDRADRLRRVAARVDEVWGDNLDELRKLPFARARRELQGYPSIGEAGADRILLLSGAFPVLGLDSNALRVLQRLGYGRTDLSWARAYRQVQAAADAELPRTIAARRTAFLLLRRHGQTLCRRMSPRCDRCPLVKTCPFPATSNQFRRETGN